jgi:DNA-binding transcriptional LysR family regulator
MPEMRISDVKKVDLNLLVLLDQILEQGNLSRAADKLNLSQPAASRLLRQLREQMNDPVLVTSGRRSVLSARMEKLRAPLRVWLDEALILFQPPTLELATVDGLLRIFILDHLALLLLPALLSKIGKIAPQVKVQLIANIPDPLEELRAGRLDLVVGEFGPVAEDFTSAPLFQDRFVCVGRQGSPCLPVHTDFGYLC